MQNNIAVSLYNKRRKGVIYIEGTGVFISPKHILTCYHVSKNMVDVRAIVYYPNKLVHIDTKKVWKYAALDVALLEIVGDDNEVFDHVSVYTDPTPLDKEIEIICPHDKRTPMRGQLKYTQGLSFDYLDEVSYLIEGPRIVGGISGSPVLYESSMIGLIHSRGLGKLNKYKSQCVPILLVWEKLRQYLCSNTLLK